jgi:amino acid adenylation domain-containing protein/thioester reductase-like protein
MIENSSVYPTVIGLLENVVLKKSEKVSLIFRKKRISYGQLHSKSNQLAHYLFVNKGQKQKAIAFCLEQSIERVISMISIWKAGYAYMSLDSSYPTERLQLMIVDAAVETLITTKALMNKFKFFKGVIIVIDDEQIEKAIQNQSQDSLRLSYQNELAYLAYTSGSTGIPKAIMANHQGLGNFVVNFNKHLDANDSDNVLQISGSNFDGIGLDLWAPLCLGTTIHLYPDNRIIGEPLLDFIVQNQITILPYLPVSILATLPMGNQVGSLRKVFTGGEAPTVEVINYWKSKVELYNMYGPTETTVVTCLFKCTDMNPVTTIGKPFDNVYFYVLDEKLQEVPVGQSGHLHIGGIQVANGYLNRPELTKERFITITLSSGEAKRVYKTGDIVTRLPDGNYVFVGRADLQVKIRGFRVELSEIEEVLRQSGQVHNCAIVVKGEEDKKMYCFYTSSGNITSEMLRNYLIAKVPAYMIPSAFVHLEEFPLTSNGKIDRNFLAKLEADENHELRTTYVRPQTVLQQQLVDLWSSKLGTSAIGIDDSFFHFGGNSILSYKLIFAMRDQLKINSQITDLFLYPTIREFAQYIAERKESEIHNNNINLAPEGPVPLSSQQRSLWFLDRLTGSLPYHIGVRYQVKDDVDCQILEKAIQRVIHRHRILRTVIHEENNIPYQTVLEADHWKMNRVSSSFNSTEVLQKPFDLSSDFMLQAYLSKDVDQKQNLYVIVHHIAIDGWSMSVFVEEINRDYSMLMKQNLLIDSKDTYVQYRDYALWQQGKQTLESFESRLDFWKEYLKDIPTLQLPCDYSRSQQPQISGKQHRFIISDSLRTDLQQLSLKEHSTLYTTLLSAFGLLLQYHTGQDDICIGTPVANRTHAATDKTIGYFVNMLPIRLTINGNPDYTNYLQDIRLMLPLVFSHQDVPLEIIVQSVAQDRMNGYNPLFQTVFILQEEQEHKTESHDVLYKKPDWLFNGKSKFDLQFEVIPNGKTLEVIIEYADTLFSEDTIADMANDYERILRTIVKQPQVKIGDIVLRDAPETHSIPSSQSVSKKTLVGLFEEQANTLPDKIALTFSGVHLSYKELNDKSSIAADYLMSLGVKKDMFVACLLDPSIERVITLLAIIKAGAAYVPLDVNYPQIRIQTILKDTLSPFIISSKKISDLANQTDTPVLYIEDILSEKEALPLRRTYVDTHAPSDIIYVIHTSGTTGTPKGVLIKHESISNFVTEYADFIGIESTDRTLQFSPYNFDGSVMDLWIPLTKGATLHLYPNNKILGQALSDFLQLHSISILPFISPSVLSTLPQNADYSAVRVIATGAESCPASVRNFWENKVKFINAYGPTEATVAVNKFVFQHGYPSNTLGISSSNNTWYVLDKYLRLCPIGVVGELYLSGIQLAQGYLNQPELNAEKFLKNPFAATIEGQYNDYGRMYKTGDRARFTRTGLLEYMGRVDHQIKIRGYRVELSEIENALIEIPGVENAVVQVVGSGDNSTMSIRAFVSGTIESNAIQRELTVKLPSYMIPSEIIPIAYVPISANGKIDTKLLAAWAEEHSESIQLLEIPNTHEEAVLQNIFKEVLQRTYLGLDDDFFCVGGHSLLLVKLYNRILQQYPGRISLSELYMHNSVRKLALLICSREDDSEQHYCLGTDPLSAEIKRDAEREIEGLDGLSDLKVIGNFKNPKHILLTGATGFVGTHLLVEFLEVTTADIHVLIRSNSRIHAEERLHSALEEQLLNLSAQQKKRVKIWSGDLSQSLLGLSEQDYDDLADTIDVIYHAGSAVNFIQPYSYMKAANVDGLLVLIKLATNKKLKQISLLSTVGVYSWEHYFTKPELMRESDSIDSAFKYLSKDMGYIQSKWVMEKIAAQAISKGVPIIIFRLGYVFSHSDTGATARYQWWGLFVKTCIELKKYPMLQDQKEEFVTVDFIARSVAHISKNSEAIGNIFHLSPKPEDNITVVDFFEILQNELSLELEAIPYKEWLSLWESDEDSPLYPLLSLFAFKVHDNKSIIEIHQNTPNFDISNTLEFLSNSNIQTTKVDKEMLAHYCKYLGVVEMNSCLSNSQETE